MSKYYNPEIPSKIHFIYGGKYTGKTYYEFNKLKKENQKLQEENEKLNNIIDEIKNMCKEEYYKKNTTNIDCIGLSNNILVMIYMKINKLRDEDNE